MKKILNVIHRIEEYFVLITVIGMLIVMVINIICRSLLNTDFLIGDELARYLMIFGVYIGVAIGVRKGSHVGIRALVEAFPGKTRKGIDVVQIIFTICVYAALTVISFMTARHFWNTGQQSTMMRLPMGLVYSILPLGFFLSVIHSIENLVTTIKNKPQLTDKEKVLRGEVEI